MTIQLSNISLPSSIDVMSLSNWDIWVIIYDLSWIATGFSTRFHFKHQKAWLLVRQIALDGRCLDSTFIHMRNTFNFTEFPYWWLSNTDICVVSMIGCYLCAENCNRVKPNERQGKLGNWCDMGEVCLLLISNAWMVEFVIYFLLISPSLRTWNPHHRV